MSHCANCGAEVTRGARYCTTCGAPVEGAAAGSVQTRRRSAETLAAQEQALLVALRRATLGEYEVLGEIGRGGMAVVYLAHDLALDRKVAIKVMSPALVLMDAGVQERFKREARTAAALSHPHIIPVFAVKQSESLVFFVMKFVAGRSLESVIKEVGAMPIPVVQTVVGQTASALGHAHKHGVVHRDMKPGNVMLDEDGWVVVTDFGIAKVAHAEALTQTGGMVGTPAYMSPEQCGGNPVTGASDQYSLGVVAYEMLTGRQPFASGTLVNLIYDHCHTPPPPLLDHRPDCPPQIAAAVMRMLAKDPAQRWPTVEDAAAAIGVAPETERRQVQTSILTLAQSGGTAGLLEKFRTPGSPVPRTGALRRASAPGAPAPGGVQPASSPTPRARRSARSWAIPLVSVAVLGGAWIVLRPPGRVAPVETAPPSRPTVPAVARVELAPLVLSLKPAERAVIRATGRDAAGVVVPEVSVSWGSSDAQVATVSADGSVLAVAPGVAEISARSGAGSAAAVVTVTAPRPTAPLARPAPGVASIAVQPDTAALIAGESVRLAAVARDEAGNLVPGRPVRWATSDSGVARVAPGGLVTGLAEGTASIEAVIEGRGARAVISVTAPPAPPAPTPPVAPARAAPESVAAAASTSARTAVPVPPRPSDPRPDIERALEAYRRAIESRDLAQLRAAYPGLTAEQERAWQGFFDTVTELTAALEILDLRVSGDQAQARVAATYDFRSGTRQTQHVEIVAALERGPVGWRIIAVK